MRLSKTEACALRRLADGERAERIWTGREYRWFIGRTLETRAVNGLIKKGLVWTHYPTGRGSAGINDDGKRALDTMAQPA